MRLKRNKFGAIKVKADCITFDSKLEHKRYQELKLMEKAGRISCLAVHKRFDLHAQNGRKVGEYELDFGYFEGHSAVYEDCKGMMTPLSKWKIKHFELEYGIKVEIIRA